MGYWEQIGAENQRRHERRGAMNPHLRAIKEKAGHTAIMAISLVLWVALLLPVYLLARQLFF